MSSESWNGFMAYDLQTDPREQDDLLGGDTAPEHTIALKDQLIKGRDSHLEMGKSFGDAEWTQSDEELKDQLEAMGYA
jgi:hypothetical protein